VEALNSDVMYSFYRGDTLFCFTNIDIPVTKIIKNHPYHEGTKICNILNPNEDCIIVSSDGINVVINDGEAKIFTPAVEVS